MDLRLPTILAIACIASLITGCSRTVLAEGAAAPVAPGRPALLAATLVMPVVGISPHELRDTFDEPRSGGRRHSAIDIPAGRGTAVVAVADGSVLKLHQGAAGGLSVYLLADDGRTRYYYAHLDRYARGLREGNRVRRGQVIGAVGDTGNAGRGNYHLHFSIAILDSPARWWEGENLNPFPILKNAMSVR